MVAFYSAVNGLRFFNVGLNLFTEIVIAVTGAAIAVCVTDGLRIYVAFCDATGRNGISQGYVFGLFAGQVIPSEEAVDKLFAPPLPVSVVSLAITQPTTGVITAGTHRVGYVFTTRNGDAAQILNPVDGTTGVFAPVPFTAADGVHNCQIVFTFVSLPTYLSSVFPPTQPTIQVVMTSAANPAEYYLVPGAIANCPATPSNVTINFSITDGDLVTGTNVTQNQNVLTQALNGTGPFNPSAIFTYSSRMAYVTLDSASFPVVYFSDVNDYQSLSAATSGIYLEGRQIPIQGCSLGGACYIATLSGLYSTQDNGGAPSTWISPSRIDGSVGIISPTCMLAAGGKMLLASEKGLYIYRGGSFPSKPLSYWQSPDWGRINWLQPTQVQIVDDALDQVIRVQAPLKVMVVGATDTNPIQITTAIIINSVPVANPHLFQTGLSVTIAGVLGNTAANTTAAITVTGPNTFTIPVAGNGTYVSGGVVTPNAPNAQMTWNYSAGDAPGEAFYSLCAFGAYRASSMATIRNINNGYDETWWAAGNSNPGGIIRRVLATDITPYRDVDLSGAAAAIKDLYETSLLPGSQDENVTVHDFSGAHFRMSGVGSANFAAYSLDHAFSLIPLASPFLLSQKPGVEYLLKWILRNEQQTISWGCGAVDAYVVMSLVRCYFTNSLPQR